MYVVLEFVPVFTLDEVKTCRQHAEKYLETTKKEYSFARTFHIRQRLDIAEKRWKLWELLFQNLEMKETMAPSELVDLDTGTIVRIEDYEFRQYISQKFRILKIFREKFED